MHLGRPTSADGTPSPFAAARAVQRSHLRRLAPWALAACALAVAVVSGLAIARGYADADAERAAQAGILDVRGHVLRAANLELTALVDARPLRIAAARAAARAAVTSARGAAGSDGHVAGPALRAAARSAARNAADLDLVVPGLPGGRRAIAGRLGARTAEATHALTASAARARDAARASMRRAAINAAYVFLAALLSIGVLLARSYATRRVADIEAARGRAVRDSERWFRGLVQNSSDVILVVAPDSTIRYATPSAEAVLGARPEQLDGRRLADLADGEDRLALERALVAASGSGASHRPADWRLARPDGASVVVEAVTSAPDGEGGDLVVTLRDVGERRALEAQLRHRAFHDELTGLANRPLFEDRTTGALARARRSGHALAVLFLDLDDFKTVNDALGHGAGDELLCEAARRVAADLRASDTAARLGGDEFALLLDGVEDGHAAMAAAERLLEALAAPFTVAGKEVFAHASIGLAIDSGRRTADELLRDADAAMYEAKRQGKRRVVRFEPSMHASVLGRLQLRADLERALDRDELILHYQPIVRLDTGEVEQLEALVRWRHAARGLVPPDEFIPLAEETGFIVPLGRHVLRAACREARSWADLPGGRPVGVSVNVSPRQLAEPGFVDEVVAALGDAGLPASSLVLEITEHALMGDADAIAPGLHELRAAGVRIALDDFGTGYSSLAYLRHVPLDSIKVDRGFVGELDAAGDHPLVRSITGLGESLGLRVVAEGIEARHQLEALRALGCELGQGYLFSKPLPADQIPVTLAAGSLLAPPESA